MRRAVFYALFLLPVLILLPHLGEFPYQTGAMYSDLAVSHYPNTLFLQRSLLEWKTIPLWSPAILSGYPFAANPLSGLFYLPGWLALLFPLPLGLNISLVLHLIFGGMGMYLLLRQEGLSEAAALLSALAFEAMPKLFSHLGAGHLTLVYAVCWTPWLLFVERKTAQTHWARWTAPGVLLGVIVLADVRWAAYAGLFWLAWSIKKPILLWIFSRLSTAFFAFLVAAPLLLPLAQYTMLSTRAALTAQDSLTLSLPPGQLFGLIYPYIGGTAEWVLYPGAVLMGLALYAVSVKPARRAAVFWLVGIPVTLLLALGSFLPVMPLITRLPGMDLLRVPPRVLFLTGLCFASAAAYGLDALLCAGQRQNGGKDRSALVLFGVSTFIVLLGTAAGAMVRQPLARIQFLWGAVFFLLSTVVILLARSGRLRKGVLVVLILILCLVDLNAVNGLGLDFRPFDAVFGDSWQAAGYLKDQVAETPSRVYSPSYSLPQHTAAWFGLELADGIDPLQLAAYTDFLTEAADVEQNGYSVTLPPFASANPAVDNQDALPDAERLGLLNVGYVVSAFPIASDGLVLEETVGETRIYRNTLVLPRAWVQPANAPIGEEAQPVTELTRRPNTIMIRAEGPGLLVLSGPAYPGWQVTVDGVEQPIETTGGLFQAVQLYSDNHNITFTFRPVVVYLGLALALLGWAALAGILFVERMRHG